jgi:hypothetical protein
LEQVGLDEERRDSLGGVHDHTRVVRRRLALARVSIAHLVPDRREAIDDLNETANHLLEVVIEV